MCKNDKSQNIAKVEHYYNIKKSTPVVLDSSNPTVGLTNAVISTNNGFLTCKFNRIKKNSSVKNYFDLDKNYYVLGASGSFENGINTNFFNQK